MNPYAKGRRYEYKTRDWLIQDGARCVIRAAGSHGVADLIAVYLGCVTFVQVKSGRRPSTTEVASLRHAFVTLGLPDFCSYLLVWWNAKDPLPHLL